MPTAVNIKLQRLDGTIISTLIHVQRLKRYETPKRPPPLSITEQQELEQLDLQEETPTQEGEQRQQQAEQQPVEQQT